MKMYPVLLSDGRIVSLIVPDDLTPADAEYIAEETRRIVEEHRASGSASKP